MKKTLSSGSRVLRGAVCVVFAGLLFSGALQAQEPSEFAAKSTSELVTMAWAASSQGDYQKLDKVTEAVLASYEQEALVEAAQLNALPGRDVIDQYNVMNDLATILFVRAEALMHQGKPEEAIAAFTDLIKIYPYAQSWDPSRGSYWSIAEKSQESIDKLTGADKDEVLEAEHQSVPVLNRPGLEDIIDYKKYGTFSGVGTKNYKFTMGNPNVLARAVGEGIYPNTSDVLSNPRYKDVVREGRVEKSYWDLVNSPDREAAYFKWAMAPEPPGVRLFFLGLIFENSGMYLESIKAYQALIVNFPNTVAWTYWQTPWYPAQAAVGKIKNILRMHPELGLAYKGGKVDVINGADNTIKNDVFVVNPGQLVRRPASSVEIDERNMKILGKSKRILGGKKTRLVQYANGHWRMFVNNKPFIVKAITYAPTKVGQSADKGTISNWTTDDMNFNGKVDSAYDSWVDKNGNNVQDPDEPVVGDFQLLKEMGANTIRLYHQPHEPDMALLRDLYARYGIRVIMGDFLGKYTHGSGASWSEGTDYGNSRHRAAMMKSVEEMVLKFKDEPFVLFWLLGNENNYGVASNADKKPKEYYEFVNLVALRIKELDPSRPVAICNGDTGQMEYFAKHAPAVDIYGANVYRGDYGFGSFWSEIRRVLNRPAFITEYGAPAFVKGRTLEEADAVQASYHMGSWFDIVANSAGMEDGEGNAIGGIAFEWMDEWWKNYEPSQHDTKADVKGPFAGGYYYEEWFGIVSQGNGRNSPYLRHLRKAYDAYKKVWAQ